MNRLLLLLSMFCGLAGADDRLVDIGFVVDVSGSFSDDIANFRSQAAAIIEGVTSSYPNAHFGLASFQDFPLRGWGSSSDVPHALVRDIGIPDSAFTAAIDSLSPSGGGDGPESQLVSLYQSITGLGSVVPPSIDGGYTIPPGLNFNFRDSSARVIILWTDARFHDPSTTTDYPGPTAAEVISAALDLDRRRDLRRRVQEVDDESVRVVAIVSSSASDVLSDIAEISIGTGAVTGPDGLDCDGDGSIDIAAGEAIICPVAGGLTQAIVAVVDTIVPTIPNESPTDSPKCFPGNAMVLVEDKGATRMDALEISDRVLVAQDANEPDRNRYETLYSFGHYDPRRTATYLQFMPDGLEISSNHLVYIQQRGFIPASWVRAGDTLSNGSKIQGIHTVEGRGLYAPLTPSGTIVVNGVVVSTYALLIEDHQRSLIPYYHRLAHLVETPHRIMKYHLAFSWSTKQKQQNDHENYGEDGFTPWVEFIIGSLQWLHSQRLFVRVVVTGVAFPSLLLLYLFELGLIGATMTFGTLPVLITSIIMLIGQLKFVLSSRYHNEKGITVPVVKLSDFFAFMGLGSNSVKKSN